MLVLRTSNFHGKFTEKFSRTTTIHPGIFGERALCADSGPPRMNTIASRDQFKPIRIGENLVVNYNKRYRLTKCVAIYMFIKSNLKSLVVPVI